MQYYSSLAQTSADGLRVVWGKGGKQCHPRMAQSPLRQQPNHQRPLAHQINLSACCFVPLSVANGNGMASTVSGPDNQYTAQSMALSKNRVQTSSPLLNYKLYKQNYHSIS